jgi:hypothetical protein
MRAWLLGPLARSEIADGSVHFGEGLAAAVLSARGFMQHARWGHPGKDITGSKSHVRAPLNRAVNSSVRYEYHQLMESKTIKLLDIIEATTVNAVAKNAIEFHRSVMRHEPPTTIKIQSHLATFHRGPGSNGSQNQFVEAVRAAGLKIKVIPESFRFDPRVISELRELSWTMLPTSS